MLAHQSQRMMILSMTHISETVAPTDFHMCQKSFGRVKPYLHRVEHGEEADPWQQDDVPEERIPQE